MNAPVTTEPACELEHEAEALDAIAAELSQLASAMRAKTALPTGEIKRVLSGVNTQAHVLGAVAMATARVLRKAQQDPHR